MDRWIGASVVYFRGDASQKALADAMRDRGHKWSQSTVWAVEKGDRPLKLAEAHDVAEVLDATVESLLVPPEDISYWRAIRQVDRRVRETQHELFKAAHAYETQRLALGQAVEDGVAQGYDLPEERTEWVPLEASKVVDRAVQDAAEEHETAVNRLTAASMVVQPDEDEPLESMVLRDEADRDEVARLAKRKMARKSSGVDTEA